MRESTAEANGAARGRPTGPSLDSPGSAGALIDSVATDGAARGGSLLDLQGTVFDDRFRVEERIAEGGFAVVYKAWQVALDRRVALKVLKTPRSHDEPARAEFREKFAAEAKTIARLRHPHIVDVYDFSVSTLPSGELAPWMALEWLDGETLAVHLGRRRGGGQRGTDPREAVEFLRPVIEALAHAHRQGIVHRDIKPANIMVTRDGARAVAARAGLRHRQDHGRRPVAEHREHPDGQRTGVLARLRRARAGDVLAHRALDRRARAGARS